MSESQTRGGLYPVKERKNERSPSMLGSIYVPENARPGDKLKLAGWPARNRNDGALDIRARSLTPEEQDAERDYMVKQVLERLEQGLNDAQSKREVDAAMSKAQNTEAWLHLREDEQTRVRTLYETRVDALSQPQD